MVMNKVSTALPPTMALWTQLIYGMSWILLQRCSCTLMISHRKPSLCVKQQLAVLWVGAKDTNTAVARQSAPLIGVNAGPKVVCALVNAIRAFHAPTND